MTTQLCAPSLSAPQAMQAVGTAELLAVEGGQVPEGVKWAIAGGVCICFGAILIIVGSGASSSDLALDGSLDSRPEMRGSTMKEMISLPPEELTAIEGGLAPLLVLAGGVVLGIGVGLVGYGIYLLVK